LGRYSWKFNKRWLVEGEGCFAKNLIAYKLFKKICVKIVSISVSRK
jgi:hypothetical protein